MKRNIICIVALGFLCLVGCKTGIHEDVIGIQTLPPFDDYRDIRSIAVVPFRAYYIPRSEKVIMGVPHKITEDNGKIMCDIFTQELRKRVRYKVIRPEKVAEFFKKRKEKIVGILDRSEVQRVGRLLNVDALVMGQVDEFSAYQYRMYENSRVSLKIRMSETSTGELMLTGRFRLDQEGMPHEVAQRGARMLIEQLMTKKEALEWRGKRSRLEKSL